MKATLEVINQMCADGVIGNYAIGGAVGATFYLEPVATLDIDVFVSLQTSPGSRLISLTPIYDYLQGGQGVHCHRGLAGAVSTAGQSFGGGGPGAGG